MIKTNLSLEREFELIGQNSIRCTSPRWFGMEQIGDDQAEGKEVCLYYKPSRCYGHLVNLCNCPGAPTSSQRPSRLRICKVT